MNMIKSEKGNKQYYILIAIFVFSGFAGLIYQSIWSHYLSLFLGNAAYAQALVLSLFMGGMAIGATLASKKIHRWKNIILAYAIIEAIIGLLGITFHFVFTNSFSISFNYIIPLLETPFSIDIYRWSLGSILIVPQTVLLGMTFPLMCSWFMRRFPGSKGHSLGSLYFANSIGAAVGVLCSAFILLPVIGLQGAITTAGILNLFIALIAYMFSRQKVTPTNQSEPKILNLTESKRPRKILAVVLVATFFSSAASFSYEIIFIRSLSLAVGSTLQAFEIMLASFIAGIAFGALWIRKRADGSVDPLKLAGWLQIFMGLTALLALVFYANSFTWVSYLIEALSTSGGGYQLFNIGTALIAIFIMMPTAFFAGTTLPLFTVALLRNGHNESVIGRVYAWNTTGAILGVFVAIHFLIPQLGLKLAMFVSATVDIAIGLIIIRNLVKARFDTLKLIVTTTSCITLLALFALHVPFNLSNLSSGVFRSGDASLSSEREVFFYKDGKTATVSVIFNTAANTVSIATNGKVDAAIQLSVNKPPALDEPTMILLGALPLAYNSDAKNAAVIGFGSGLTTHTLLGSENLTSVDTIEIEQAMVQGASTFEHLVDRAFNDSRSNIIIDDAKSYFSGNKSKYDIIISEPSNPWISGVGSLFSTEFYSFIPKYLNENGIFIQWLQLYEIDDELVSSVLRALLPQFKDVHAYLSNSTDLIIIASNQKLSTNPNLSYITSNELGKSLSSVGITNAEHIEFRKVANKELLESVSKLYTSFPKNSDYFPVLSIHAPRTRFQKQTAHTLRSLPTFNLPFLEQLNIRNVHSSETTYPEFNHFEADRLANQARNIVSYLESKDVGSKIMLNKELTFWLESLKRSNENCWNNAEDYSNYLTQNIYQLSILTLPYLKPSDIQNIIGDPVWLKCQHLPDEIIQLLAVVKSIAERDNSEVIKLGINWLDSIEKRPKHFQNFDSLFYVAVQLSFVAEKRHVEALDFTTRERNISLTSEDAMMSAILRAYIDK